MLAIKKRAGDPWGQFIDIENELKPLQEAVGGNIELVQLTPQIAILCNEEGLIRGLKHNCNIMGYNLFGDILLVGTDGEDFCDLPDENFNLWVGFEVVE